MTSLTVWDDSHIQPGSLRQSAIDSALAKADFAIPLVSADFLASSFITTVELPRLLSAAQSGGTRILPVIVQPCFFEGSLLAPFQAVNDPTRPLSGLPVPVRETIWVSVVRKLIEASRS
jgi:TIR domain